MSDHDVILVASPIDLLNIPSLAVGTLKACLTGRKISCKAIYSNLIFINEMGHSAYQELFKGLLYNILIECLFAPLAHEGFPIVKADDLNHQEMPEELRQYYHILGTLKTGITDSMLKEGSDKCRRFIKTLADKIVESQPKIIGFSNSYLSTNVAIALGREVKRLSPRVVYVVGGANCHGTMGEELVKSALNIDYVFQGDSDDTFPDFCERYLNDGFLPPSRVIKSTHLTDLDMLPVPDYSDLFDQPGAAPQTTILSFESSRGCWWGEKNRCKFCSESEGDLAYRTKSSEHMIEELFSLSKMYPEVKIYMATDAISPESFFRDVLPHLIDGNFNKKLICETRVNLTPGQITMMKKCGLDRIQVGIESLSTRLLKILNKGTSALNNIRFLRDCREGGVQVIWLFMVGIPGDSNEDYADQLRIIPWIEHLIPPEIAPMRIQRFSPFFENPEKNGITKIQPLTAYKYAFPATMDINRLAYYFRAEYPSCSRNNPELMSQLVRQIKVWQDRWRHSPVPELSLRQVETNKWEIRDTRSWAVTKSLVLDEDEYLILKRCRKGILTANLPSSPTISRLLEYGYLLQVDDRLLSVVCDMPSSGQTDSFL
jgi:ribosomal peptide maturation radical SAM protein 1